MQVLPQKKRLPSIDTAVAATSLDDNVIVVAFDIETRGKSVSRNGILAVGIVAGYASSGNILSSVNWHVAPLDGDQMFEPQCVDQFWSKYPGLREQLQVNPVRPAIFAAEFRGFLDMLEKYNHPIYLVSDNPTFDAGFIDYYLDRFGYNGMQHSRDGNTWRRINDSDSYARGVAKLAFSAPRTSDAEICASLGIPMPTFIGERHVPVNDALHIFRVHCAIVSAHCKKNIV